MEPVTPSLSTFQSSLSSRSEGDRNFQGLEKSTTKHIVRCAFCQPHYGTSGLEYRYRAGIGAPPKLARVVSLGGEGWSRVERCARANNAYRPLNQQSTGSVGDKMSDDSRQRVLFRKEGHESCDLREEFRTLRRRLCSWVFCASFEICPTCFLCSYHACPSKTEPTLLSEREAKQVKLGIESGLANIKDAPLAEQNK